MTKCKLVRLLIESITLVLSIYFAGYFSLEMIKLLIR